MLIRLQAAGAIVKAGGGAVVKAGGSAIAKHAPKAIPHVTKQMPKAVTVATTTSGKVAGLVKYLKGFRPGQIKKLLPWVNAALIGWGIRDGIDSVSDEFRGIDWSQVEEEDVEEAAAEEESSDESSESTVTPDTVTEAGMTGGGSQFDTVVPVPTEPDSVEAGENAFDPDELTMEQLDEIKAGIDPIEQEFGDSPDPALNPFFENEEGTI